MRNESVGQASSCRCMGCGKPPKGMPMAPWKYSTTELGKLSESAWHKGTHRSRSAPQRDQSGCLHFAHGASDAKRVDAAPDYDHHTPHRARLTKLRGASGRFG
eukprot:479643-Pleurochrysis_carterae.AAC.1